MLSVAEKTLRQSGRPHDHQSIKPIDYVALAQKYSDTKASIGSKRSLRGGSGADSKSNTNSKLHQGEGLTKK